MHESKVPSSNKWTDSMKYFMLENVGAQHLHLKSVKDMAEKLKTNSGDTLSYNKYQQMLKSHA